MKSLKRTNPSGFEFRRLVTNPIVKKDLRSISRSMKFAWGVFAYEGILAAAFWLVLVISDESSGSIGYMERYRNLVAMFPVISAIQLGIMGIILPIMTASSISGEKERQTFDILMTTIMTPRQIIYGKLMSAVSRIMVFVIASIPLMAVSFILGGMNWMWLFVMLAASFVFAMLTGAVGMLASTIGKKSLTCIIIAYVMYFGFYQLTTIPTILIGIYSTFSADWLGYVLLLFNPVVSLVEMFVLMFAGEGILSLSQPLEWLMVVASWGVDLLFTWGLIELAARRIDPMKTYRKKAKAQPANVGAAVQTGLPKMAAPIMWNGAPVQGKEGAVLGQSVMGNGMPMQGDGVSMLGHSEPDHMPPMPQQGQLGQNVMSQQSNMMAGQGQTELTENRNFSADLPQKREEAFVSLEKAQSAPLSLTKEAGTETLSTDNTDKTESTEPVSLEKTVSEVAVAEPVSLEKTESEGTVAEAVAVGKADGEAAVSLAKPESDVASVEPTVTEEVGNEMTGGSDTTQD